MKTGTLQIERIKTELRTKRIGKRIEYVESTTSTNEEARKHLDLSADGVVIFTEHQSGGKGRHGKTWQSPRGASLLCSTVLIQNEHDPPPDRLVLISAVAAVDAIARATDVTAQIKWPNDLRASGKKLGGILIEFHTPPTDPSASASDSNVASAPLVPARRDRTSPNAPPSSSQRICVIGIGLNCLQHKTHFSDDLQDRATSLELESDHPIDRTTVAIALLTELDRWLGHPQDWTQDQLLDAWRAKAEPMGTRICLKHAGSVFNGTLVDVDPQAALIVRLDNGALRAFDAANTATIHDA